MLNGKKTAEIIWLNYHQMMKEAEKHTDEEFFERPLRFHDDLVTLLTHQAVTAWNPDGEYDLIDNQGSWRGSLDVVSLKINADCVSWHDIVERVLELTKREEYRLFVLMLVFSFGDSTNKVFISNGQFTSVLFDYETECMFRAF